MSALGRPAQHAGLWRGYWRVWGVSAPGPLANLSARAAARPCERKLPAAAARCRFKQRHGHARVRLPTRAKSPATAAPQETLAASYESRCMLPTSMLHRASAMSPCTLLPSGSLPRTGCLRKAGCPSARLCLAPLLLCGACSAWWGRRARPWRHDSRGSLRLAHITVAGGRHTLRRM